MGLLKHVLFWPVTGPAAMVDFSLRQVEQVARDELTDDERIKEDLMALHMELELGDIDEDEYRRREAELMERLREARAWRVALGMEEEWAPLGYSGPAEGEGAETDAGAHSEEPDEDQTCSPDS